MGSNSTHARSPCNAMCDVFKCYFSHSTN